MKRIILIAIFAFLLSACNHKLKIEEVDVENVNHQVREIIQSIEKENGNYFVTSEKEQHVFINRMNKVDGDKAISLSELTFDVRQNVLNISFSEQLTADDSIHQRLYKITGKGDYDTVIVVIDGETVPFNEVFVR